MFSLKYANYNVMALIEDDGDLVERYEYTPYGERQVYFSAGTDDPLAMSPITNSRRVTLAGSVDAPYGLLAVGHQGLFHDEESGLIYNRARMLHTRLGRFAQRDPLGYVDGMSLYEYVMNNPIRWFDPWGLHVPTCPGNCNPNGKKRCFNQAIYNACVADARKKYNERIRDVDEWLQLMLDNINEWAQSRIDDCLMLDEPERTWCIWNVRWRQGIYIGSAHSSWATTKTAAWAIFNSEREGCRIGATVWVDHCEPCP